MPETSRQRIAARLAREGWTLEHGKKHDKFKHPGRRGVIILPRHREVSDGVARGIAQIAGWEEEN